MKHQQVSTSESVDVDYLTPTLHSHLEMVATGNGSSDEGVRVDMLLLDFCLPCDMASLDRNGQLSHTYSTPQGELGEGGY